MPPQLGSNTSEIKFLMIALVKLYLVVWEETKELVIMDIILEQT